MMIKNYSLIFFMITIIGCSDSKINFKTPPVNSFNQGGIEGIELSYTGSIGTSGFVDVPLSVTPSILKSSSPIVRCEITPSLPTGLSIHNTTCVISGTPTEIGGGTYKVTASNSMASSSAEVEIMISPSAPTLSYAGVNSSVILGSPFNVVPILDKNGEDLNSCLISPPLPAPLVINGSDCTISGTLSSVHNQTYTVTASNSAGSAVSQVTIVVLTSATAPSLSYNGVSGAGTVGVPLSIVPSTFQHNGAPTTCSISPALSAGLVFNSSTCVISGTPSAVLSGPYNITAINSQGSVSASVQISIVALAPTLSYNPSTVVGTVNSALPAITANLNNGGEPISSCVVSPALPSGVNLNNTTCAITGTPTAFQAATQHTITVTNADNKSSTASFNLAVHAPPTLSYSLSGGTNGTVNTPMSVTPTTLLENGGAITDCYASPLTPLPAGLSISTSTCVISGTPTSLLPTTSYHIYAKNQYGDSAPGAVTLSVAAGKPSLSFAAATGTVGAVNSPMTVTPVLNVNGAPLTSCDIKAGTTALPAGLTVDSETCIISGVSSVVVNPAQTYTITATNSAGSTDALVSLSIIIAPPSLSYAPATGSVNTYLNVMPILNPNGATTTCALKVGSTPLPAGLGLTTIAPHCVIYGTPSGVSSGSYTIVATNSAGSTEATLNLTILPSLPSLSYSGATGTSGFVGYAMNIAPTSINENGAPITSCSSSPALPDGLSVTAPSCVISGTPTEIPSNSSFTITATNSAGSRSALVYLRIHTTPTLNITSLPKSTRPVSSCMGPMALYLTFNNDIIPLSNFIPVDLQSSGSGEFYSNQNCTGSPITSTDLGLLGRSGNFYFKNNIAETITITADPNGAFGIEKTTLENVKTLWSVDTWIANVNPHGTPSARFDHTAVWTGKEMIVWGGGGTANLNTGGRYNPSTNSWVGATSTSDAPTPRSHHSAVWTGTEMIIWSGSGPWGNIRTGGRYNPVSNSWTPTNSVDAPPARIDHSAVWTGTEMIIWGGNSTGFLNTGARYNPSSDSWVGETNTNGAPSARFLHTAIWTGTEMIIWGGGNPVQLNTGGRYNPSTDSWVSVTSTNGAPTARYNHSAIWTGTEMIIWGGSTGSVTNTGGRYNPSSDSWNLFTITGAPARDYHSAIWTGTEMIVWGGRVSSNPVMTGFRYDPYTNSLGTSLSLAIVPSARYNHSAVWTGTEMIIWGGRNSTELNTGGRYHALTDSWTTDTNTVGAISARYGHSAVWTGTHMVIWGGETSSGVTQTGGLYNPVTQSWSATSTGTGVPFARSFHSAVYDGSEMIIWGGKNNLVNYDDGARYNPSTNLWVGVTPSSNRPSPRHGHTAIWTGEEMIVWGGYDGVNYLNDGKVYDKTEDKWMYDTQTNGAPAPRSHHTAIWTGEEMIVWGGTGTSGVLGTGGKLNPSFGVNSWSPSNVSILNRPSPRQGHSAIWTGSLMITWGGRDALVLEDGHIYQP